MVHPKVAGATAAAALAALVIAVLKASGVQIDGDLSDAIVGLVTFIGGYLMPSPKGSASGPTSLYLGTATSNAAAGGLVNVKTGAPVVTDAEEFATPPPAADPAPQPAAAAAAPSAPVA